MRGFYRTISALGVKPDINATSGATQPSVNLFGSILAMLYASWQGPLPANVALVKPSTVLKA